MRSRDAGALQLNQAIQRFFFWIGEAELVWWCQLATVIVWTNPVNISNIKKISTVHIDVLCTETEDWHSLHVLTCLETF